MKNIEDMKADLIANGWVPETPTKWKSPSGALFRGPFGAWKNMLRQKGDNPDDYLD